MVLPSRRRPKAQRFRLRELRSDVRSLGLADLTAILRSPTGVLLIDAGIKPRIRCAMSLPNDHVMAGMRTVASRGKWSDSMAADETTSSFKRQPAGEQ